VVLAVILLAFSSADEARRAIFEEWQGFFGVDVALGISADGSGIYIRGGNRTTGPVSIEEIVATTVVFRVGPKQLFDLRSRLTLGQEPGRVSLAEEGAEDAYRMYKVQHRYVACRSFGAWIGSRLTAPRPVSASSYAMIRVASRSRS